MKQNPNFRNLLSEFVFLRTYARWLENENRRETWIETVDRYMNFMRENLKEKLTVDEYEEIRQAILHQEVMPSMRLMQFAGSAALSTNVCAYNCAYIAPNCLTDLGEIMYIAMCGTGVGFSVESQNIQLLPIIKIQTGELKSTHIIEDSKEGWSNAFMLGLKEWYAGNDLEFDYSKLRPAGARLKIFGGRSSGPEPFQNLMQYTRQKVLRRQGRRLTNLDVHDLICKIGEVVMLGGVRRAAMISLSDLDDVALRHAKSGMFFYSEPERVVANNSAVYLEKPSQLVFLKEWLALMESGTGERGIFNRSGLMTTLPKRRINFFKTKKLISHDKLIGQIGTNPCGEIILQSKQFCNLSEIVARPEDSEKELLSKIRVAAILGTYQSTLTYFPFISSDWKTNCEEERLLGVSITGHWDCPAVREERVLLKLKEYAIQINQEYAARFNINAATAVTCVKPSGNVSQLVDCASGMHPRHAEYYIRRIRVAASDPLLKMLKNQGIIYYPEVGQTETDATLFVVEFPVKSPSGAITKDQLSALEHLNYWKKVKRNYTEHNPSITISVGDEEWISVANWLYENWNIVGGLSFLPRDQHVYPLPPYETITKAQYESLAQKWEKVDFAQLATFELSDQTDVRQELACLGPGSCDV